MSTSKKPLTLVVLAAGLGSRYGGLKQLESIGPNGEILMDYSFYDAIRSGFDKIVCVIRKSIEKDFRDIVSKKWEGIVDIAYTYQEIESFVPQNKIIQRQKPWGTGHAILCAKPEVTTPFVAINADDFYGYHSFLSIANFLLNSKITSKPLYALVAFELQNTISENGSVSRGLCEVNEKFLLKTIQEHKKIFLQNEKLVSEQNLEQTIIDNNTLVSMNFWGFMPSIFLDLENGFHDFLSNMKQGDSEEYYIPYAINNLIQKQEIDVTVLHSAEKWLGVTYKEDRAFVQQKIINLIANGVYPNKIY